MAVFHSLDFTIAVQLLFNLSHWLFNMISSTILPPQFETERLILKPLSWDDLPYYEQYFIDYEVIRHLSAAVPWPYPKDGVSTYLQRILAQQGEGLWSWGIHRKTFQNHLIGVIELFSPGRPENRGFWLGKQFWGLGYMTEAVHPVIEFAFSELGFNELIFSNAKGNERSRRIKEKTGALFYKTQKAEFVDRQYHESELWKLDQPTWIRHQRRIN